MYSSCISLTQVVLMLTSDSYHLDTGYEICFNISVFELYLSATICFSVPRVYTLTCPVGLFQYATSLCLYYLLMTLAIQVNMRLPFHTLARTPESPPQVTLQEPLQGKMSYDQWMLFLFLWCK